MHGMHPLHEQRGLRQRNVVHAEPDRLQRRLGSSFSLPESVLRERSQKIGDPIGGDRDGPEAF